MQAELARAAAHLNLTEAAHSLRVSRPGMSLADAFELAALREPDTAHLLDEDVNSRAARGHAAEQGQAARREDALSVKVRQWCAGPGGKVDPVKLRRLADANGLWRERYDSLSLGSQVAAVLSRLRVLVGRGGEVVYP